MDGTSPNEQLAKEYFKSVTQCASDWRTYLAVRRAIKESTIDLRAYFEEKGSFRGCKIPGVGQKTYDLLARIIREGVSTVAANIVELREEALRPKPGMPDAGGAISSDVTATGELHNTIRALEQEQG